ncbi:hypothetical protein LDO26_15095 [Luteimonas sp. BDR2-5]|uniref:hypothetical protein n=1 Tax=Proluteimonas luteida TaxID=2878685 RepID=UPI001E39704F|nr:hypothetical protein [Luteimonas sp. BDR2-5]MCD9029520.1 hypothetical protein [Luteimonas sp. BDR2-5]
MKSIDHKALACIGTSKVCRSRFGNRFFVRRGRFSASRQYTCYTRLWFQGWPSSRNRRKHFQNPQTPVPGDNGLQRLDHLGVAGKGIGRRPIAGPLR